MLNSRIFCIAIFIFCVLFLVGFSRPGYCAGKAQGQEILTATGGKIIALDWLKSTLTIRINFLGNLHDEMTLFVSPDTKITKGNHALTFGELQIQDHVKVEYSDQHFRGLEAIHIIVLT